MGPAGRTLIKALGKIVRNLRGNPRFYGGIAGSATVTSIAVINHRNKQVSAKLNGSIHHDDGKIGDHHLDADGNEYIVIGNKRYRYDATEDIFYNA